MIRGIGAEAATEIGATQILLAGAWSGWNCALQQDSGEAALAETCEQSGEVGDVVDCVAGASVVELEL